MEAMAGLHQWTITMYTHTGCVKALGKPIRRVVPSESLYDRATAGWSIVDHARQWGPLVSRSIWRLARTRPYWPAVRFDRVDETTHASPMAGGAHRRGSVAALRRRCAGHRLLTMSEGARANSSRHGILDAGRSPRTAAKHPRAPFAHDVGTTMSFGPRQDSRRHRRPSSRSSATAVPGPTLRPSTVRGANARSSACVAGPLAAGPRRPRRRTCQGRAPCGAGTNQIEDPIPIGSGANSRRPTSDRRLYPNATPGERWWNR